MAASASRSSTRGDAVAAPGVVMAVAVAVVIAAREAREASEQRRWSRLLGVVGVVGVVVVVEGISIVVGDVIVGADCDTFSEAERSILVARVTRRSALLLLDLRLQGVEEKEANERVISFFFFFFGLIEQKGKKK